MVHLIKSITKQCSTTTRCILTCKDTRVSLQTLSRMLLCFFINKVTLSKYTLFKGTLPSSCILDKLIKCHASQSNQLSPHSLDISNCNSWRRNLFSGKFKRMKDESVFKCSNFDILSTYSWWLNYLALTILSEKNHLNMLK